MMTREQGRLDRLQRGGAGWREERNGRMRLRGDEGDEGQRGRIEMRKATRKLTPQYCWSTSCTQHNTEDGDEKGQTVTHTLMDCERNTDGKI